MTDREAPVDDRTTGESPHELLLALAGRIDDDLLAWCRELVAVGEDARALELITATLIADRTALPEPVRAALVGATRRARRDLDADAALAPAVDVDDTAHRFDTEPPGTQDLAAAVGALPTRQIAGCRSWVTMRTTPAGSAPGPLPQAVVLVEVAAGDTRPHDIMAYQLAIACARTGVPAAVEVVVAGADRPAYHEAALASAIPVHGADEPVGGELAAGPEFPRASAAPVVAEPAPVMVAAPELLSPGSPQPMLAAQNTGPVEAEPVTQSLPSSAPAPAPRPFPRRSARRGGDDDAGAAFRAASAQSAPVSFESGRFASSSSSSSSASSSFEPSSSEPSEPSVPESSGSRSSGSGSVRSEHAEPPPMDEGLFDAGRLDPSPESGTSGHATADRVPADPGTPELPRRPRPVTALRGLTPPAPRPDPVRPSGVTPMPRPQPVPSPGRRGNLIPVAEPAAVRALPAPGAQQPADTPAFASLGDPLDGPVEDRPTPFDERAEPVIDENDPLGLGLMPVSAPERPEPEPSPVSDSWLTDWITGDWAMSPSALDAPATGDRPHEVDPLAATEPAAIAVPPTGPRPRPEPVAEPDATRTGRRRAGGMRQPFPVPGEEGADDHQPSSTVDPPAAVRPPVAEPPTVEPAETSLEQTGFVLRPESVARLSDTDRELLARLQAELAGTPRPRMTRRAGIAGSNGSATHGSATNGSATNGSAAPPDRAG